MISLHFIQSCQVFVRVACVIPILQVEKLGGRDHTIESYLSQDPNQVP